MPQLQNILIAAILVVGSYWWSRVDFRRRRWWPIRSAFSRRLLGALGWLILAGALMKGIVGRDAINDVILIGATGIALIAIARRPQRRPPANATDDYRPWATPFQVGARYRIARAYRRGEDDLKAGEEMVFERDAWSRYDAAVGYFFRDDAGKIRRFDVYSGDENPAWEIFTKV
jgi:hypothetical protein